MLLYNAKIWTGSGTADWLTLDPQTGYVLAVGSGAPPTADYKLNQQRDLGGKQVFPGFHDSHIHLMEHGKLLSTVNFWDCMSITSLQQTLADYAAANPDMSWISGQSWNQEKLGRLPTRLDLDEVCPDRPVLLTRYCMHVSVVNSKGLECLGITESTPQPEGGQIDVFPTGHTHSGQLSGILRENAHTENVLKVPLSSEEKKEFIKVAIKDVMKNGVTSVHVLEEEVWDEYCELVDEGALPLRVFYAPFWANHHSPNYPPGPTASRGELLTLSRIKLFTDGALGVSTAALSQPYVGTCNCGMLIQTQGTLTSLVTDITQRGFRLEIHAIGDAAAEAALTALEEAKVAPEKRPIFAHCQILRKDLLPRLAACGVIATIQPQFVVSDGLVLDKFLPESLKEYSYVWKTMLDNNILCAGSSDAPVEEPKPMLGMYDVIFRQVGTRDPSNENVLKPDQCFTFKQAVDLYTKAGAYTAMREDDLGQLLPGYKADLVVLEGARDLEEHPEDLLVARVAEVWVDGLRRL